MNGEEESDEAARSAVDLFSSRNRGAGGVSEIEEEEEISSATAEIASGSHVGVKKVGSFSSFDFHGGGGEEDAVFVAVLRRREKESMDALIWTLNNLATPSSSPVFLIRILPETKFIPTPLGKLPVSQVNAEQKQSYEAQQKAETIKFLQKFIALCSSKRVKVDTVAVESDDEGKAISELIEILKIRKLVLGISQEDQRKMGRRKRGNGVAGDVVKNAAEFCEIRVVCEGKEVSEAAFEFPQPHLPSETAEAPPVEALRLRGVGKEKEKRKFGCFAFWRTTELK